jgi:hypothetical protein
VSADAGVRKSLAFVLAAEGWTSVDYADLASALTASTLATCRCAIIDEVEPGDADDLAMLPAMPVIVLCDREAPEPQRGRVHYFTKPILGPKLIVVLRRLLAEPLPPNTTT